jgi:hypothetical protein
MSQSLFGVFGNNGAGDGSKDDNSLNLTFGSSKTPQLLITSNEPKMFSSAIENYLDCTPIIKFRNAVSRNLTVDSSDHLTGDGTILAQSPVIFMKNGEWGPMLQECLIQGSPVASFQIKRIATLDKEIRQLQVTEYINCFITKYEQIGDEISFAFAYHQMTDAIAKFLPDGTKKGSSAYQFNYGTFHADNDGAAKSIIDS